MKTINTAVCLALAALLLSCSKAMNPEELYNKTSSGVVMIVNRYYYSVTLPNGEEIFFTAVDGRGELQGLTASEDEAKAHCSACTGTGFFISADGQLMTNRHVVSPEIDKADVKNFLMAYKRMLKDYYQKRMRELAAQYESYEGMDAAQATIARQYQQYSEGRDNIDELDMNEADISAHCQIGIAYNNAHVTKADDLKECVTVAVSDKENVDLAIIQLKDNETPADAYVFQLKDDDDELTLDQKLYMIGFNYGFTISKTAQGIKSQIYSGNVTQKGDGERILYSIASLPGSSGSPVIDEYGRLVAVNFAGMSTTQNFNYGIPTKKIRQYLLEN